MSFITAFFRYIVGRLNERSTWGVAVPLIAGAIGMEVSPDMAETIGTIATGLALALPTIVPDGKILPPIPTDELR